jgi:hypothetical protein
MASYTNCAVSEVQGAMGARDALSHGFNILSGGKPVASFGFASADEAQAAMVKIVEKAVEIMPHGKRRGFDQG